MFAGVADGHRFSMMFNTYTMSEHVALQSRPDPDAQHHRSLCRAAAIARSISASARTTTSGMFCKDDEPIFDSFIPLTARGSSRRPRCPSLNRAKRR